jgi:hypothetical protein
LTRCTSSSDLNFLLRTEDGTAAGPPWLGALLASHYDLSVIALVAVMLLIGIVLPPDPDDDDGGRSGAQPVAGDLSVSRLAPRRHRMPTLAEKIGAAAVDSVAVGTAPLTQGTALTCYEQRAARLG